jgi:shikimate dehydrogenase
VSGLRAGLLGRPVAESLSPLLHQTAGAWCGLEVEYRVADVGPEAAIHLMNAWRREGLRGFNITAPHKRAAARWVDRCGPIAARAGAVNTVVCGEDGRTVGYNTDVDAFAQTVGALPERVVVLGAGGAVRAVVVALLDRGVPRIELVNRSRDRALALAAAMGPERISVRGLDEADEALAGAELVVNGLPATANPWICARRFGAMARGGRLFHLGYGPRVVPVREAVLAGSRKFDDGLEMLARQGIAAFVHWTGLTPPLEPLLAALRVRCVIDTSRERIIK